MISPIPPGPSSGDADRSRFRPETQVSQPVRRTRSMEAAPQGRVVKAAANAPGTVHPLDLLNALRRRWRLALALALPAGVAAAALAWMLVPVTYTAYALLRVSAAPEVLVFDTAERTPDFETYRKTQTALISSRFALNAALRRPGVAETQTLREQRLPIEWLEENLEVESWQSPEILKISLTGRRPEELALIVNAVKEAYLDEVVNAERRQRIEKLTLLEETYRQTHQKVLARQARVDELAKQLGTGDSRALTVKQQMALEYYGQLRREHARVRFELMQEQVRVASGAAETEDAAATAADPLAVLTSADPEAELMARRATQLKSLIAKHEKQVRDPNHIALAEYRAELAALEQELADRAAQSPEGETLSRLETLQRQEELLREEAEGYSDLVTTLGTTSFELETMRDELEQVKGVSDKVGAEMEALRIELAAPPRVVLLQDAETPREPDLARRQKLAAFGGIGALGLVLAAIALLEYRNRRVTAPEDVAAALRLNVIGTLPAMQRSIWNPASLQVASRRKIWDDAVIESADAIRTLLLREASAEASYAIMIASAGDGEGKTTLAGQLAASLARAGRRTVLVDCDLRRPAVHRFFGLAQQPGLTECLRGECLVSEAVHETSHAGLSVVPAGRLDATAIEALARDGGRSVLDELRARFEFVVIDTSPLLYVADSGVIGQNVDAALLAVRRDVSRMPMVAAACERLDLLGVPVLGTVVIGVPSQPQTYGYSHPQHQTVMLNSL